MTDKLPDSAVALQTESIAISNDYTLPQCHEFLAEHSENQAIDYYLARDLCQTAKWVNETIFYTLIRLSQSLRSGHSCLQLAYNSGQPIRRRESTDDSSGENKSAPKCFPDIATWSHMLNATSLLDHPQSLIVLEKDRLYLRRYWLFEQDLSTRLRHFMHSAPAYASGDVNSIVDRLFPTKQAADLIDWQKAAVINCVYQQLGIIAGGPGTGKTTTVTKLLLALLALYHDQYQSAPKIKLVAPTGKAAQRLQESITAKKQEFLTSGLAEPSVITLIPSSASTLHRLLGYIPNYYQFRHHEENLLDLDILVVDEASMIDLPMMTRLFRALPNHAQVILLGDADQLPSVETGSVLAELVTRPHPGYSKARAEVFQRTYDININYSLQTTKHASTTVDTKMPISESSADHVTLLQESYRFRSDGGIGNLAKAIIAGQSFTSWQLLEAENKELALHKITDTNEAGFADSDQSQFLDWLQQHQLAHYQATLSAHSVAEALRLFSRFRILTATRVGPVGVVELNAQIESILSKNKLITLASNTTPHRPATHYHGRPIMVTENDYASGLYNGDIGMIWQRKIEPETPVISTAKRSESDRLQAAFLNSEGGIKWVSLARLPKVESVFAMTIHKTQGSEFDEVALVLPSTPSRLLSRELIYTAVTRAKNKLDVFTRQHVWRLGVEQTVIRYAGLREKVLGE